MFLLHEYDIFWTFLITASLIPILAYWISGLLAPVSEGPKKLSSYESVIEPLGGAWLQLRIRYYMFALVFIFLMWKRSFFTIGQCVSMYWVYLFLSKLSFFVFILVVGLVYAW